MRIVPPPLPHSLASLIVECQRTHFLAPDATLAAAMALHADGAITDPITDTRYLPTSLWSATSGILAALASAPEVADIAVGADPSIRSDAWDDSKVVGAAHAIIPAPGFRSYMLDDATETEREVFASVACALLVQFYPPMRHTKETVLDLGWRRVMSSQEV